MPSALRGPVEPGSLTTIAEAPALFARYPAYAQVLDWVETFVVRPHPRLGRPGPVCPRMAPAIRRNLVRLVAVRTRSTEASEAYAIGVSLAECYPELFGTPGEFSSGALLAVFPDLPADAAPSFIDEGHARLRMEFVSRGLMLGEFHPNSPVRGVHGALPVMRSPVPMFVVRALSRHDLLFLDRPATPPADLARYLRHLLRHVGNQLTRTDHDRVQARLAELETPR